MMKFCQDNPYLKLFQPVVVCMGQLAGYTSFFLYICKERRESKVK